MEGRTEVETDPITVRGGGTACGEDRWEFVRVATVEKVLMIEEHIGFENDE